MSEKIRDVTAYFLQETKGAPISLCVIDHTNNGFHVFPISTLGISRLVAEGAAAINESLGGLNPKWPLQEIATALSKKQEKK